METTDLKKALEGFQYYPSERTKLVNGEHRYNFHMIRREKSTTTANACWEATFIGISRRFAYKTFDPLSMRDAFHDAYVWLTNMINGKVDEAVKKNVVEVRIAGKENYVAIFNQANIPLSERCYPLADPNKNANEETAEWLRKEILVHWHLDYDKERIKEIDVLLGKKKLSKKNPFHQLIRISS